MNEENDAGIRTSTGDRIGLSDCYISEHDDCLEMFNQWSELEQVNFVEKLLSKMCHSQLGQVDCFLRPMLQRDFISALPGIHVVFSIMELSLLSIASLYSCSVQLSFSVTKR